MHGTVPGTLLSRLLLFWIAVTTISPHGDLVFFFSLRVLLNLFVSSILVEQLFLLSSDVAKNLNQNQSCTRLVVVQFKASLSMAPSNLQHAVSAGNLQEGIQELHWQIISWQGRKPGIHQCTPIL